ncbi:MAG TPA: hypothetical protein VGD99_12470, partial [Anaerolineae bacterium]
IVLVSVFRTFPVILILWAVGLAWGSVLAYRFSQILFGRDDHIISEEQLQAYLDQAQAYKAQIDRAIKQTAGTSDASHLTKLQGQIDTWTEAINELVQRLNSLRADQVIRRDLSTVPKAIADLEKRVANETDAATKTQLERVLANRRKQLASLQELQNMIKRAEIQIENTLSMLGTIYSQILTGQSTSHVADYGRLSTDVDEEVRLLQDHLEALREVKLGGSV